MKNATFLITPFSRTFFLIAMLAMFSHTAVNAQISFDDEGAKKADSRRIRREAAKYKADAVKESHLDMDKFSYKRGEPGNRPVSDELQYDDIYYGPSPVKKERRFFKKKR